MRGGGGESEGDKQPKREGERHGGGNEKQGKQKIRRWSQTINDICKTVRLRVDLPEVSMLTASKPCM